MGSAGDCLYMAVCTVPMPQLTASTSWLYHHAGIIGTFAVSNDENCNARQATKGSCLFLAVEFCREEKIRKLEQQLRTAYGSLGRAALRASGPAPDGLAGSVRVSRVGLAATQAPVAQSLDETIEVGLSTGCFATAKCFINAQLLRTTSKLSCTGLASTKRQVGWWV